MRWKQDPDPTFTWNRVWNRNSDVYGMFMYRFMSMFSYGFVQHRQLPERPVFSLERAERNLSHTKVQIRIQSLLYVQEFLTRFE